ncbi:MAG: sigma-70 family RNA polymerase sigma factor [Clostridia bacterium]|nr:sigma-70 family RNA polymerase sigma factor [Clostridia bacterium]
MEDGNGAYRRFLAGEDDAIAQLVAEYRRGLYHYLLGLVHDPELADDLTEDTFVKLLVKRPRNTETCSFRTWLYTIGRNLAVDHFRRQGRRREIRFEDFSFMDWALPSASELYDAQTDASTLNLCMERLPDQQRQALYLRFFEDFSIEELAKIMGLSRHNASQLVYRAKKSLKEELLKEGFTYEI